MSHDISETTRLMDAYRQLLDKHMTLPDGFLGIIIICVGSPNSNLRKAFTAMLTSLDAGFAEFSANETYREAMMKD